MKNTLLTICLLATAFVLNAQSFHGKKIKANKKSIEATQLASKMDDKSTMPARVTGVVEDVCQAKGCWMKVATVNGGTMRVTFKDYAFFVPKDIAGKKVTFEGKAVKKETSIAELKHYAEDAGKSPAEIAKITTPEYSITFEADGVIVEK
jgi:starvation-inducible outer membrane lipoprotein